MMSSRDENTLYLAWATDEMLVFINRSVQFQAWDHIECIEIQLREHVKYYRFIAMAAAVSKLQSLQSLWNPLNRRKIIKPMERQGQMMYLTDESDLSSTESQPPSSRPRAARAARIARIYP